MNKGGETAGAHPEAFAPPAHGKERAVGFAGLTAEAGWRRRRLPLMGRSGCGIKSRCFPLFDDERSLRANGQAETGTIAKLFAYKACLTVHDLDGSFRAGRDAEPAAGALFLVDADDLAFQCYTPLSRLFYSSLDGAARPAVSWNQEGILPAQGEETHTFHHRPFPA
ncbi:MAG: hypothetical protein PWR31_1912 [Bacillota bacterium]|nr:hypothetical protein [Bacillota bacterium]